MEKDLTELEDMLFDGALQPPMTNGEVSFAEPWQGRVFGMARVLAEAGHYSWDEFRAELIRQIDGWDRSAQAQDPDSEYHYYDHFLAALQTLLKAKGMLGSAALEARFRTFEARPHGHDHHHEH